MLLVRGCRDSHGVTRALLLGSGLRSAATVEARRADGPWQPCGYIAVTGTFDCNGLLTAYDGTANLLNDAAPSWGFVTPAIVAFAYAHDVQIRIRLSARLSGTYQAAVSDGQVRLGAGDGPLQTIERQVIEYADLGERAVELRSQVPLTSWAFTLVREDTVVPPRPFLDPPPGEPPPAVRAIH